MYAAYVHYVPWFLARVLIDGVVLFGIVMSIGKEMDLALGSEFPKAK